MKRAKHCGVREIAALTQLNISTVSRALRRDPKISAATTVKVFEAAHRIGYFTDRARQTAVVMLPDDNGSLGYYALGVMNALCAEFRRRKWSYEFLPSNYPELVNERTTLGIISMDYSTNLAKWASAAYNLPIVCINDYPRHIDRVYSILSDEHQAITLALDHLIKNGHRNILYIDFACNTLCNQRRRESFEMEMQRRHLEPMKLDLPDEFSDRKAVVEALKHFLSTGGTALICPGEGAGPKLLECARGGGIAIPGELTPVLWNSPQSKSHFSGIATVEQDFLQLAQLATETLDRLRRGEHISSDLRSRYVLFVS